MKTVSVIGDGKIKKGSDIYDVALKVGRMIASKGYVLVCGGLLGVMEAASRGAKEENGITVGILPTYEPISNDFIDIRIPTGLGQARNVLVVSASELIIAVGGSYGTLSEIAHAMKMGGKRIIGYKTLKLSGVDNYTDRDLFLQKLGEVL